MKEVFGKKGLQFPLISALTIILLIIISQGSFAFEPRLQEKDNYCGIAVMQGFYPNMSQDAIAQELHKWRYDLTYSGDFMYFFNKHEVDYHWGSLGSEFPAIVLLSGPTFGLSQNHFVVVLGERNGFYYIFDPLSGYYKKPYYFLKGKPTLIIDE